MLSELLELCQKASPGVAIEYLRAFVDNELRCGVAVTDSTGILYVNARLAKWYGGSKDDLVGAAPSVLIAPQKASGWTPEAHRLFFSEDWPPVLAFELRRRDGTFLPVTVVPSVMGDHILHLVFERLAIEMPHTIDINLTTELELANRRNRTVGSLLADALRGAYGLTERESQVSMRLLSGTPRRDIAESLGISLSTVQTHVAFIYRKLKVGSRTELLQRVAEL